MTRVLSSLAFGPGMKLSPSGVDLLAAGSLSPNEEAGQPEEPDSEPHLQPCKQKLLLQLRLSLHHLSGHSLSSSSCLHMQPGPGWTELTIRVVYLVETGVSAGLPSSFSLHHPPPWVSLSPEQGRSSVQGGNNHQKTTLGAPAERLARGRGPRVLSRPITSVPFRLQGRGGEGGGRP